MRPGTLINARPVSVEMDLTAARISLARVPPAPGWSYLMESVVLSVEVRNYRRICFDFVLFRFR